MPVKVFTYSVYKRRSTLQGPYRIVIKKDDGSFLDAWGNAFSTMDVFAVDENPLPDLIVTVFLQENLFTIDLNLQKEIRTYSIEKNGKISTPDQALFYGIQEAMKDKHVKWFFASRRATQPAINPPIAEKYIPTSKRTIKNSGKTYERRQSKEDEKVAIITAVLSKEFKVSEDSLAAVLDKISFRVRNVIGKKVTIDVFLCNKRVRTITRTVPTAVVKALRKEIGK